LHRHWASSSVHQRREPCFQAHSTPIISQQERFILRKRPRNNEHLDRCSMPAFSIKS
jgi:hypothetical protein